MITYAYVLINRDLLLQFSGEIVEDSNTTITRRKQEPRMVDIYDEEGNITGQRQNGWIISEETEEVPVYIGAYSLIGRFNSENYTYSAILIKSPGVERLVQIAQSIPGSYLVLMQYDDIDGPDFDAEFIADESLDLSVGVVKATYDEQNIPYEMPTTPLEKLNFVITFPMIGANPITGQTNRQILENLFRQVSSNWKVEYNSI